MKIVPTEIFFNLNSICDCSVPLCSINLPEAVRLTPCASLFPEVKRQWDSNKRDPSACMYVCVCGLYLSVEVHYFGCELQQPIQCVGKELPREQEADGGSVPVVLALAPAPQHLEEPRVDTGPYEPIRVGPAFGPVNPGKGPVRVPLSEPYVH